MRRALVGAVSGAAVNASKLTSTPARPVHALSILIAVIWTGREGAVNTVVPFGALAFRGFVVALTMARATIGTRHRRAIVSGEAMMTQAESRESIALPMV